MAESNKSEKYIFDGPTKGLIALVVGLAALIVGLSWGTYLQLPKETPRARLSPRPRRSLTPTPKPSQAGRLPLRAPENPVPSGWFAVAQEPENLQLQASSGAIFEQKILPLSQGLSPRTIAESIDQRLSRWGQEYQRVRLESVTRNGVKMTCLEYALNLPGKPTQRTLTVLGRVRVNGERRVAMWTLASPEESFERDKEMLESAGVGL